MSFLRTMILDVQEIWDACANAEFLNEMADGTLSKNKFKNYIIQDSIYLKGYLKEFAYAIIKASTMKEIKLFYSLLGIVNDGENSTRLQYLHKFGLSDDDIEHMRPNFYCKNYLDFLNDIALNGDVDDILIASFPCMIGYYYIFNNLKKRAPHLMHSEYAALLTDYTSDEYGIYCENWISYMEKRCEDLSQDKKEELFKIFTQASMHELNFFRYACLDDERINIRVLQNTDIKNLAQLYTGNWKKTYRNILPDDYLDNLTVEESEHKWRNYLKESKNMIFVIECNETFQGFVACKMDDEIENCIYLDSLHVSETSRGKGYGTLLIRSVANYGYSINCSKMSICIVRGNEKAKQLYKKLGAVHYKYFDDDFYGTISHSEKLLWRDMKFEEIRNHPMDSQKMNQSRILEQELWDIYDVNRRKTGKIINRGDKLGSTQFHMVVNVCIFNSKNEMLIQQRQSTKSEWPELWDISVGGNALSGETSQIAAERETFEEIGLIIDLKNVIPHLSLSFAEGFDEIYLLQMDLDISTLKLQKEEVQNVKWATENEIIQMIKDGKFIPYYPNLIKLLFDMKQKYGYLI